MKFNIIIFICILTLLTSCYGQTNTQKISSEKPTEPLVTGDTVRELSNNIMVIFQDKKNNFWFGSWQDGLYKYDGKSIIHFTTKHGFPSNRVEEIKEDEKGNIYFNTSKGILKYNGYSFTILKETIGDIENWDLSLNDIWFKNFTEAKSVYRYDGAILHRLKLPKIRIGEDWIQKNPTSPNPYSIYCTYKDSKGNIWFGTAVLGAFRYDGSKFDWITESDVNELHYGPSNGVRSIVEDKDGYFWFNTEYKYDIYNKSNSTKSVKESTQFYDRIKSIGCLDGKKDGDLKEYLSIIRDNNNSLWIVTYLNGAWKVDGENLTHYPIEVDGKSIPIFYVFKDNQGGIWIGTHENGVFRFNGQTFVEFVP
jgi:ligand-binding sensor domain-containing protein